MVEQGGVASARMGVEESMNVSMCGRVCRGLSFHISCARVQGSTKDDGLGLVSWWR